MKTKTKHLLLFLLSTFVFISSFGQPPLVYNAENTATGYTAPPLPTLANCPTVPLLPDPFAFADGSRSTAFSDWEHHRSDFKSMFENYEIGTKPTVDKATQVTASYSGNTLTINITANGQSMTMTCAVSIPSGATAPYPVCIGMNSSYGSMTASEFTSRGIVGITFSHDQVTTYTNPANTNPFFKLYPTQNIDNTGQYAAWSWGVSRIIDGLEKVKAAGTFNVDLNHIAVSGCSYAGKMALFSGAFDERIALTIAQESGGGGATSWRYSATRPTGTVEGLAQTDSKWFKNSMFDFGGANVSKIPTDHHMLMAMCAPRALFATGNTDYEWLSNMSFYVCNMASAKIYSDLGISDRFGFVLDGGHSHCAVPSSQNTQLGYFLNKFMKSQSSLSQVYAIHPAAYDTINYAKWYSTWGGGTNVPVTGVSVNPTTLPLNVGGTSQLTATVSPSNATNKSVTWSSSNTAVATVSSTGLVTGVANGTATITVTTADGAKTATSAVTVTTTTVSVTGVSVSPTPVSVNIGATSQLTATVSPSNASNKSVTWSSNNTAVATVNSTGLVTGVAVGTATITVTSADGGFTATSVVTVTQSTNAVNINVGGSATGSFSADQYFSGGTTYTNTATIDLSQITSNAPPAAIFNTERYGAFSYTIPNRTAGSAQTVTLYFAETYVTAAGQRIFNVSINGTSVLSNFDIYAVAGGQNKAIARSFNTTANSNGQVVIQFNTVTENPKVNGITVADNGNGGPTLSVSTTSLSVAAAANSTGTFSITSNTSWTVSSNQSWLAVNPASGSNNGTVTVTAQQNTGSTTRSATVTASATGVTSQTVTITQAAATVTTNQIMLEAECGTVGSLFNVATDANASNGTYVTVIAGNNSTASAPSAATGWITLPFTISQTGTYTLWARVMCPDANGDSFWLKMDNGSFVAWNNITTSTSWIWVKYTSTYSLTTTGSHTFTIGYREDGAKLDKIYLTSAGDTPTGTGASAANLCTPVLKSAPVIEDNLDKSNTGVYVYPNPVTNLLKVVLGGTPSTLVLYNNTGNQLLNMTTEKTNVEIDMTKYSAGIYFLKIMNGDQTIMEKIVKQ